MAKKGSKRIREAREKVDNKKLYSLDESLKMISEFPEVNFDESIEMHFNLGVNPKYADQMVRGTIVLPNGIGKEVKVLVFAKGDKKKEAEEAGADFVGSDDIIEKIEEEGWTDFDIAIATPNMMGEIGKLGRILGPRGLMPNPKAGTMTDDVKKAVKEAKAGKMEYKVDKFGVIHTIVGKRSFDTEDIKENILALTEEILNQRPKSIKGRYLKTVYITPSMNPSIKLDPNDLRREV
ncbi:MAG: 50S ribosomal protein L1 [Candidatus Mcinerneyibacterium aminivorans]|uniref:Large ribosomal subunit protein uL1 n=1 Tax=Candidatus Mcinerneyibacterium aminivorans TaxID=2703815 RepID=A0A5D0MA66_9BACT|nr:MAG: 50S ribosomal protein L1 [Candidatus Mcinerneyibacterium aminivorans]